MYYQNKRSEISMNDRQTITLDNGTTLTVSEKYVSCRDCDNKEVLLSVEKQRIIRTLANNLNSPVDKETLYKAYTQSDYCDDPERVVGMIYKMPNCIRDYILTIRGIGYRLVEHLPNKCAPKNDTSVDSRETVDKTPQARNCPGILTGDYYGFFLDPVGLGTVVGAYIRIEDGGQEPVVSAVLGIRTDSVLFSGDLAQIFSCPRSTRPELYHAFHEELSKNDRRCFWCSGQVRMVKTVAELTLTTPKGAQWSMVFELGNYLDGGRSKRHHGDDAKYRGGLGLCIALSTQYGTFAGKFGMVRKEFCSAKQSLTNTQLQTILQRSIQDANIPLMIDPREDNYWYSWFMSEDL